MLARRLRRDMRCYYSRNFCNYLFYNDIFDIWLDASIAAGT